MKSLNNDAYNKTCSRVKMLIPKIYDNDVLHALMNAKNKEQADRTEFEHLCLALYEYWAGAYSKNVS